LVKGSPRPCTRVEIDITYSQDKNENSSRIRFAINISSKYNMLISVVIPSFNPSITRLEQTLNGLRDQTLEMDLWELIIIDNNSEKAISDHIDLSWHKHSRIIKEPNQGLTFARTTGFLNSKGEIIVLVDDDNVLNKEYLQLSLEIFNNYASIAAIGGKSIPKYETTPPVWLAEFQKSLALRDAGNEINIQKWEETYPDLAPIGAGMAIRKMALDSYVQKILNNSGRIIMDRKGASLGSAGDNDIVLEILKSGWTTGYFPLLTLQHIIPKERMTLDYISRLIHNSSKSWIQLLESHNINPWRKVPHWTVPLRKAKAWFLYKAWRGKANFIRWQGACGAYEALGEL
jgi:glycosyltransferase involved in cell wall biosynthesis